MLYRIWKLTIKELIQLMRDRLMAPFVLLGPLAELLMVAWSTSQGIENLPTAVLDLDRSAASRGLIAAMVNTETFAPYAVETMDLSSTPLDADAAQASTGHGGTDYKPVDGFIRSILDDTTPEMDVYKTVENAAPALLAAQSAREGGKLLDVPDFRSENRA